MDIEYYFILINSWRECNTIRKEVKVIKKQGQPVSIWTALLRRKTKGLLSASHENRMSGSIDRSSFREQVTSCNTPQHFHTDASNNLPTRVPPEERQKRKKKRRNRKPGLSNRSTKCTEHQHVFFQTNKPLWILYVSFKCSSPVKHM